MTSKIDTTLFRREVGKDFIIVQIYVGDIIFGATNESLYKDFSDLMKSEYKMSMMGELKFILGLQIKQDNKRVCVCGRSLKVQMMKISLKLLPILLFLFK